MGLEEQQAASVLLEVDLEPFVGVLTWVYAVVTNASHERAVPGQLVGLPATRLRNRFANHVRDGILHLGGPVGVRDLLECVSVRAEHLCCGIPRALGGGAQKARSREEHAAAIRLKGFPKASLCAGVQPERFEVCHEDVSLELPDIGHTKPMGKPYNIGR